jgi:mono/diheme cytochrome c family protein
MSSSSAVVSSSSSSSSLVSSSTSSSVATSSSSSSSSSSSVKSSSSSSSSVASSSSSAAAVGNATTGQMLYTTAPMYCSACHGPDGKSTGNTHGKTIDPSKTNYNGKTLAEYITANMPPPGTACNAQCGLDIAAYIKSWAANAVTESVSSPAVSNTTHTISLINDCGKAVTAPANGYKFIGDYDMAQSNQAISDGSWTWNTWAHTTNGVSAEWANTKFASTPGTYSIPTNGKANSSCNNVDTLDVILIKKYANWDHQHSNGFEPTNLQGKNINFGKVASVVIDLKINSARTSIPTQEALIKTYNTDANGKPYYTAESNIMAVDKNKVNIGFTIADNGSNTVLSASDIIEINQAMFQDQWVRVVIDMSKVKYCSTTNYSCTPITAAELTSKLINKITVVAEQSNGGVLRNSMPGVTDAQWNSYTTVPETFKELDVSIKKLEFIYK